MGTTIADITLNAWRSGRKTHLNSKGWTSGNAVCCTHNGEGLDKRGRGGTILSGDGGISYACFNCQFKTGYVPGYPLSFKFKKLLRWLGVDESTIGLMVIDALREQQRQEMLGIIKPQEPKEELKVDFKKYPLPNEALSFFAYIEFYELKGTHDYPKGFVEAVEYVDHRKIDLQKYDFYWTEETEHKLNKRVIIPMTWKNEIIGYTARAMSDGIIPKYYNQFDEGYVFNIDKQGHDWQFVIVTEGIFDALSIDAVAVMKSSVTKQQVNLIESLDREVILVPDFNKAGQKLIDDALDNGWAVSFPVWAETCVDINEAVQKYGKLFVMKTIVDGIEHSKLKIELLRRKYS
jgi:hypothetical protein